MHGNTTSHISYRTTDTYIYRYSASDEGPLRRRRPPVRRARRRLRVHSQPAPSHPACRPDDQRRRPQLGQVRSRVLHPYIRTPDRSTVRPIATEAAATLLVDTRIESTTQRLNDPCLYYVYTAPAAATAGPHTWRWPPPATAAPAPWPRRWVRVCVCGPCLVYVCIYDAVHSIDGPSSHFMYISLAKSRNFPSGEDSACWA